MIAVDMDGTLLGQDGQVSSRNLAALRAAESAGIEVVVATGRRHCYAMRILRALDLHHGSALVSSNGTVTRTLGSASAPTTLLDRTHLPHATSAWLCDHLEEFRNALVLTFDRVGPDGEDERGALVVEHLDELHASIGKWMAANEPYIAHVERIEAAFQHEAPIQMMLCGTIDRMARAEARLLEHPAILPSGGSESPERSGAPSVTSSWAGRKTPQPLVTLHRTEYPERNLSILDILPAGCSKGTALLRLAATRGIDASEILAIGDNWNDVSMLEIAGAAVLMANAPEDLKALARSRDWRLGDTNTADGVAQAIEAALATSLAL